jgi:glycogen debranching enzyme
MLDETEFLSDYGVRSLSRCHRDAPYVFADHDRSFYVSYEPAESTSGLFGGNSNWRGPIWFPVNFLIIESLRRFHHYYGDDFRVEHPTGSGRLVTLNAVADDLTMRLTRLFLLEGGERRSAARQHGRRARDPHFRDYVLFHEYFDGDDGRGLGASHQTGWTALVATLLQSGAASR